MTKLILAPALALAMISAATAPAQATPLYNEPVFGAGPWSFLIGLLLPAVQKVREAA